MEGKRLYGKVAVITGASRGIGKEIALAFAREGAKLSLWSRSRKGLESVVREIEEDRSSRQWAGSRKIIALPLDVSREREVEKGVEGVLKVFKKVDILVNSAGYAAFTSVLKTSVREWDEMMATNLRGPFLTTKAILPSMLKRKMGDIVFIASIAGLKGFSNWSGYCASKFGLVGFSKSLSIEVRRKGIRVITLCPGAVDTPLWDDHPNPPNRKEMLKSAEVANALVGLLTFSKTAVMEEVVITPRKGVL